MLIALLSITGAGALCVALFGRERNAAFNVTMVTSLVLLGVGLSLASGFEPESGSRFTYETSHEWIPTLGARFDLAIDGISLLLILLTVFLAPITLWAARSSIQSRERDFCFWFLVLHGAMLGAFMARDLFLFFVFWELVLVPMWLMIGIWGSKNRLYAGMKFFLYTALGSIPMLASIVWLALQVKAQTGTLSFSIDEVAKLELSSEAQLWCFLAFALSFAIKVPLWPFHTWLPDAHTEAPTPGSVILAGVLLKLGGYGFIRYAMPLFPEAAEACAPFINTLAVIAIIGGSLVAMIQPDIKRLVAYSSVAHMGAVMLGLFSLNEEGMAGGIFQMLAHGVSTGGLFLLVGFLYERRYTREFSEYGGVAKVMPIYAVCLVFVALSSIALPGMNGFVGEFLILAGAFAANPWFASFAVLGAILGAWYMLAAVKRILFGPLENEKNRDLADLTGREVGIMVPLMVLILWMGLGARTFLDPMKGDVEHTVTQIRNGGR